jgi:hypothetical protein
MNKYSTTNNQDLMKIIFIAIIAIFSLFSISACSTPTSHTISKVRNETILVLPPKNAAPFSKGPDHGQTSGAYLELHLISNLRARGWKVISTNNEDFDHYDIPTGEAIIREGKKLSADYALYVQLGKFMDKKMFIDALTMWSPNNDWVDLDQARLIDIRLEKKVWSIDESKRYDNRKLKAGTIHMDDIFRFLPAIAADIADGIDNF